jgi:hypothetical protein
MLNDRAIVASFRGMLPELDRLETLVEEMDEQAHRVPHRARYLRLNHAYARKLIGLHREWVEAVARELTGCALDQPGRAILAVHTGAAHQFVRP